MKTVIKQYQIPVCFVESKSDKLPMSFLKTDTERYGHLFQNQEYVKRIISLSKWINSIRCVAVVFILPVLSFSFV